MSQNFFSGMFQPVVLNASGQITVAAGYKAKFYEAGTSTPKTIYTDPDLLVPYSTPSNTAFLDDTGKALIYLAVGGYKLILTDADDVPVAGYTIDNINGEGAFGTGFVNSFEDLKDVNTTVFPYTYIGGYYEPGDGGHGMFWNETSAAALDGGYVQESDFDPTKRWFRVPDESGEVRAASFGYCPATESGNLTNNLLAADAYADSHGATLRIMEGQNGTVTAMTLDAREVVFEGLGMTGATLVAVTFNGIVRGGNYQLFNNLTVTFANASQETNPYWFGGSPSASGAVNAAAFALWKAAGAGVFILPAGAWAHTGAFTLSTTIPTIFDGVLLDGTGPAVQYAQGAYYPGSSSAIRAATLNATSVVATGTITGQSFENGEVGAQEFSVDAGGNIVAASVDSTTTVEAGTTVTAGTGITATTGNIVATAGAIQAPVGGFEGASFQNGEVGALEFSVDAGGQLIAGNITSKDFVSAASYVQATAGTSGTTYKATGNILRVVGAGTLSILANTLTSDTSYLKIVVAGTTTSATPTIQIDVGGNAVYLATLDASGSSPYHYHAEVLLFRTAATTSYSTGFAVTETTSGTTISSSADTRSASITWANANTVECTVTATNTQGVMLCEIFPV